MVEYPFQTAYTLARELYGLELNPDEFESIGLTAWSRIGNKRFKLYKYITEPVETENPKEFYVDLPCNVDQIESVNTNYEDYQNTSSTNISGYNQGIWIEGYIESRKFNTNDLYPAGKFVKYRQESNRLFMEKFESICILYKGYIVDDTGLPLLNDKESEAIAVFCAYTDMFKKALVTRDTTSMQLAQILEQKWLKQCTQARVSDYINQNEMDEILNVANSWDRKRFGRSFKPIR